MGRYDSVFDMAKSFCVCTNLTEHYQQGQHQDCNFTAALLPGDSPWPNYTCSFACKGCLGTFSVILFFPLHQAPFIPGSPVSALHRQVRQACQKHQVVFLGSGSRRSRGSSRTCCGRRGSWARITHAQSQPGRLESPWNLCQVGDKLLKIHKTIAEINILLF